MKHLRIKIKKLTFLSKLILYGCILGILPLIIFGSISYTRASHTMLEKVKKENLNVMTITKMNVEQVLKVIDNVSTQFIMSSVLTNLMNNTPAAEDFELVNDVKKTMNMFQITELGIDSVILVNMDKGWTLDYAGIGSIDEISKQKKINFNAYLNLQQNSVWVRKMIPVDDEFLEINYKNIYGIRLIKKIYPYAKNTLGFIAVDVPITHIEKLMILNDESNKTYILDENMNVIISDDESELGADMSNNSLIKQITNMEGIEGYFEKKINNINNVVVFTKSEYNDWIYMSIYPANYLLKESFTFGLILLFTLLVIILFIAIISFISSKRIYKPIHSLYTSVDKIKANISEQISNDELGIIADKVSYLVKSQDDMLDRIDSYTENVRELYSIKLIQGELGNKDIEKIMSLFEYSSSWKLLGVITIQVDSLKNSDFTYNDIEIVKFAICNIASELINESIRLNPVIYQSNIIFIIGTEFSKNNDYKEYMNQQATLVYTIIKSVLRIDVCIGISNPCNNLIEVPSAYLESVEALK